VFTLYSNVSLAESRNLFRDLQLYYIVFHLVTNARAMQSGVPVNFYAFDRKSDAERFGMQLRRSSFSGVARGAYHVGYLGYRKRLSFDLKTAYAEHLFLAGAGDEYPIWYELGMNYYLGSIYHRDSVFRVGHSEQVPYIDWGQSISIAKLLDPDEALIGNEITGDFRNAAWLLYHYLNHRSTDATQQLAARLPEYLRMRAGHISEGEAFEQGLGVAIKGLEGKIRMFYYRQKHAVRTIELRDSVGEDAIPKARRLARAEAALVLGRLARVMTQDQEAARLFGIAAASATPRTDAEARCALARLESGSPTQQIRRIEQVRADQPDNGPCLLEHAEAMLDAALQETASDRVDAYARGSRDLANTLVLGNQEVPAAFAVYGRSYLLPGQDPSRAVEPLVQARNLVKDDLWARLQLAEAYRAVNDCERARAELRFVLVWADRGDEAREVARRQFDAPGSSCAA
jgi:hypothetical protein